MTLLPRPSVHLNKSLTRFRSNLRSNTIWPLFERETWQRTEYFFVYHLGQKFFLYQTVLGQWHFSLDPQFILISPWLGWKPIYVETLNNEFFSAKFDNVFSTFFVYHLGQKFFLSQTVLGPWHSSLDPQIIWKSPWLGWKAIYVETLYSEFFSAKFDNLSSTFLHDPILSETRHPNF